MNGLIGNSRNRKPAYPRIVRYIRYRKRRSKMAAWFDEAGIDIGAQCPRRLPESVRSSAQLMPLAKHAAGSLPRFAG